MSNSGSGGCLAQIIGCAIIVLVAFSISLIEESQFHMIRQARKKNDLAGYRSYLNKYPQGRYATEAYDSVITLWDAMDFESFQKTVPGFHKAINSYNHMCSDYDNTDFRTRIFDKMKLKCEEQYNIASQINTMESWYRYLSIAPGDFQFDAPDRYQAKYDEIWGTERSAWKYVSELNTIEGYEEYEKNYPNGRHYAEAEKRAVSMRVDNVFTGQHESLPSMTRTSYGTGAKSHVSVTNSTEYTLTIYYSGIDGKRMIIPPHKSQSLDLANGTYRIAASVNTTHVRSYAGTETLRGGNYDINYYIQKGYR